MDVLQLSVNKRRLNCISNNKTAKLHSRRIDNSRRSLGKLRLSICCNMRISNKQNSSLCCRRRRSPGNFPISSRCNMYTLAVDATFIVASTKGGGA
jgi:hypothetical protein